MTNKAKRAIAGITSSLLLVATGSSLLALVRIRIDDLYATSPTVPADTLGAVIVLGTAAIAFLIMSAIALDSMVHYSERYFDEIRTEFEKRMHQPAV